MKLSALLSKARLDALWCLDVETYFDNDFSLETMPTEDYIADPRFQVLSLAIRRHDWTSSAALVGAEIRAWFRRVDWSRCGLIAHRAQFDAQVSLHHYRARPAFFFDTLLMARRLIDTPLPERGSLEALCAALGRQGKQRKAILKQVKGMRFETMPPTLLMALMAYNADDTDEAWFCFESMLPRASFSDLRRIDATIRLLPGFESA